VGSNSSTAETDWLVPKSPQVKTSTEDTRDAFCQKLSSKSDPVNQAEALGTAHEKRTNWCVVQPGLNQGDSAPTLHDEVLNLFNLVKKSKQMAEQFFCSGDTVGKTIRDDDSVCSVAAPGPSCPEVDMGGYSNVGSQSELLRHLSVDVKRLQKLSFSIRLALNEVKGRVSLPLFTYI
jgi:hypothetical protein